MKRNALRGFAAAIVLAAGNAIAQTPATTAFTYQGRLTSGGVAQSVPFDFRFKLFDAAAGGNQIGPTISSTLAVSGGLFTTSLDFGPAFNSSARWLEIAVRPAGSGNFTTLTPRQAVTAAPHAQGLVLPIAASVSVGDPALLLINSSGDGLNTTGDVNGISCNATGSNGNGIIAECDNGSDAFGVWGISNTGLGVVGDGAVVGGSFSADAGPGVQAHGTTGVEGTATAASGFGVHGIGGPAATAVRGDATSGGTASFGVFGFSSAPGGNGIRGEVNTGPNAFAVWGVDATGAAGSFAGFFSGNVQVTGNLSKAGGSFKIDDPIDPANKYLYHSFVESPDMKNIYDGNADLDGTGSATIVMPAWFQTLNRDFRYQLTAVGAPSPNLYIAQPMRDGRFVISGGTPGASVSWMITGIRQDPWANAHRIPVEEAKRPEERGRFLHPELYGLPASAAIDAVKGPVPVAPAPAPAPTKARPLAKEGK